MKLTLKQRRQIIVGIGIVALLLLVLGRLSPNGGAAEIAGALCIGADVLISLLWLRCPNCGDWLGKNSGDYCQRCGEKLDW